MYLLVQAHEYQKYGDLLDQSFKLRKKIFTDRLGWNVSVCGPFEKDRYDSLHPAYLIWCDESQGRLYGSVRLMPTTGPTIFYDAFREIFPDAYNLVAPTIWEGTRMCIDEEVIERDLPELRPEQAFCLLLLALCEVAFDNGIDTLISSYEPHMRRIYKRAGAELYEVGRDDSFGRLPVCYGLFAVSAHILAKMRLKTRVAEPLYRRPASPRKSAPVPELISA